MREQCVSPVGSEVCSPCETVNATNLLPSLQIPENCLTCGAPFRRQCVSAIGPEAYSPYLAGVTLERSDDLASLQIPMTNRKVL